MKHTFFTLTLFLLALLSTSCGNKKVAYQNPLPMAFGDPFLLKASDGKYYMYGTGGVSNGFKVYSSDDLVTWTDEGPIYQGGTSDSWATDCFWAPEVYERDGKYYLWFSANWKENPTKEQENFRIGVAVADKPTGPFKELFNQPVFDPAILSSTQTYSLTMLPERPTSTTPAAATNMPLTAKFQHGPKKRAGLTRLRKVGFTAWN